MNTALCDYFAKLVKDHARAAAYHQGPDMTYQDLADNLPSFLPPRFICEQAELAGFPVWTSAPDEALKPF